jgi:hypothetical protein
MYQVEKNLDKPAELIKAKQQAQLSRKQLELQKQQEAKQKQQDKLLRQQQEKQRKQQQQQQQAWMSGLIELLYQFSSALNTVPDLYSLQKDSLQNLKVNLVNKLQILQCLAILDTKILWF